MQFLSSVRFRRVTNTRERDQVLKPGFIDGIYIGAIFASFCRFCRVRARPGTLIHQALALRHQGLSRSYFRQVCFVKLSSSNTLLF